MKKLLFIAIAVLALTSCEKEDMKRERPGKRHEAVAEASVSSNTLENYGLTGKSSVDLIAKGFVIIDDSNPANGTGGATNYNTYINLVDKVDGDVTHFGYKYGSQEAGVIVSYNSKEDKFVLVKEGRFKNYRANL